MALLSDAGHMVTDVASLVVAYIAVRVSKREPTLEMTYGYHRVTILAALFNALTLVGIAVFIGAEAYRRFFNPQPVESTVLFITAGIGLALNLYIGLGMRGHSENVNIKSAMLHVLGDAAASAGVIVAGVIMYFTGWFVLDPIMSVIIALLVAVGAWRIIKETYLVLMEGTPKGINLADVIQAIESNPQVKKIHDIHVWSLTSNRNAMSGHLVIDGHLTVIQAQEIVKEVEDTLNDRFNIGHVTLQVEDETHLHDDEMFGLDKKWLH